MTLVDLVQSVHFCQLVAFLRILLCYQEWRQAHQDVPLDRLIEQLLPPLLGAEDKILTESAERFAALTKVVKAVEVADPRLRVPFEALLWLKEVGQQHPQALTTILAMLLTAAYTVPEMMTTAQLATLRQESEESWRQKAQNGKIPGAYNSRNRWLLPVGTLYVLGVASSPLLKEALLAEKPIKKRKRKVRHAQEQTQE